MPTLWGGEGTYSPQVVPPLLVHPGMREVDFPLCSLVKRRLQCLIQSGVQGRGRRRRTGPPSKTPPWSNGEAVPAWVAVPDEGTSSTGTMSEMLPEAISGAPSAQPVPCSPKAFHGQGWLGGANSSLTLIIGGCPSWMLLGSAGTEA